jgi:hypothetical protein
MPYTILSKARDVYSIETAFLGYDTITKERLTDDEESMSFIHFRSNYFICNPLRVKDA